MLPFQKNRCNEQIKTPNIKTRTYSSAKDELQWKVKDRTPNSYLPPLKACANGLKVLQVKLD
jgi:hypothetical protein